VAPKPPPNSNLFTGSGTGNAIQTGAQAGNNQLLTIEWSVTLSCIAPNPASASPGSFSALAILGAKDEAVITYGGVNSESQPALVLVGCPTALTPGQTNYPVNGQIHSLASDPYEPTAGDTFKISFHTAEGTPPSPNDTWSVIVIGH
jgi:hypothetical protein